MSDRMRKHTRASDHQGPNQPLSCGLRALALSNGTHGGRKKQGGVWAAEAGGSGGKTFERP